MVILIIFIVHKKTDNNSILAELNKIEQQKVFALNRIADTKEKKTELFERYVKAIEERNAIIKTIYGYVYIFL